MTGMLVHYCFAAVLRYCNECLQPEGVAQGKPGIRHSASASFALHPIHWLLMASTAKDVRGLKVSHNRIAVSWMYP